MAEQQDFAGSKANATPARSGVALRSRPPLKRESSMPVPQQLPPPAPPAPQLDPGNPTDSLSLMQLRKLVTDMPRTEPTPYAFQYQDASSFPDELEEWFSYSVEERAMLLKAQSSFMEKWASFMDAGVAHGSVYEDGEYSWIAADQATRENFMHDLLHEGSGPGRNATTHDNPDQEEGLKRLEAAVYVLLGCWYETAGIDSLETGKAIYHPDELPMCSEVYGSGYNKSSFQIDWMVHNVEMLCTSGLIHVVYDLLRESCLLEWWVIL